MNETLINNPTAEICYANIRKEYSLTKRETEILKFINYYGLNNRELANKLGIREKTVKNHMANIFRKTSMTSTRQLQAMIFRNFFNVKTQI